MGNGYNAATNVYEDMFSAGIIDPKKVTRSALQNAASVAWVFLTCDAAVTNIPEEKESHAHGGGMGYGRNGRHDVKRILEDGASARLSVSRKIETNSIENLRFFPEQ